MKWTSAAFGVRLPDAAGDAGPARSAGAGDELLREPAALHAEISAATLATATVVDRNTVFMRRAPSNKQLATRSARVKNVFPATAEHQQSN